MSSISIIIPTFNEVNNIETLLNRLNASLTNINWEVIFVDDNSPDGTSQEIQKQKSKYTNLKLITRTNERGLSGAVICGLKEAKNNLIVVMDADLQHNPKYINNLVDKVLSNKSSIVIASRFLNKNKNEALNKFRLIGSKIAIKLCQLIIGYKLTDPMSGFFIVKKSLFTTYSNQLSMDGYKVLVDLILHIPRNHTVTEIPLHFQKRHSGESKLNFYVLWDFVLILVNKYTKSFIPRKYISYFCVGFIGLSLHSLVLFILFKIFEFQFMYSHLAATISAISINYFFNNILTFYESKINNFKKFIYGYLKYHLLCSYGAFISFSIAKTLFEFGFVWIICGLMGIISASVWNFSVSSFYVWKK